MPKIVLPQELDRIHGLLAQHPDGVGIEALVQLLGKKVSRRTLQRRLAVLTEQGRVVSQGKGRALHYRCVPKIVEADASMHGSSSVRMVGEAYIPVSPEGAEIRSRVRQPRQHRQPVSYKFEFLEQYQPNRTAYLPESLGVEATVGVAFEL